MQEGVGICLKKLLKDGAISQFDYGRLTMLALILIQATQRNDMKEAVDSFFKILDESELTIASSNEKKRAVDYPIYNAINAIAEIISRTMGDPEGIWDINERAAYKKVMKDEAAFALEYLRKYQDAEKAGAVKPEYPFLLDDRDLKALLGLAFDIRYLSPQILKYLFNIAVRGTNANLKDAHKWMFSLETFRDREIKERMGAKKQADADRVALLLIGILIELLDLPEKYARYIGEDAESLPSGLPRLGSGDPMLDA